MEKHLVVRDKYIVIRTDDLIPRLVRDHGVASLRNLLGVVDLAPVRMNDFLSER
jgi:hypothetical protein